MDPMPIEEQQQPVAEDNTNAVYAVQNRPAITADYSGTPFSAVDDADLLVKNGSGQLLSIRATNENASVRFLQIHDKGSAPSDSDAPIASYLIPAGSETAPGEIRLTSKDLGTNGIHCQNGIAIGISTAGSTFTAATGNECFISGVYK